MTAGLPIDHAEHLVGVGLVQARAQLVEDPERRLGVGPGFVVALPGDVHFGVIEEAEAGEVNVADGRGQIEAALKVAVGVLPQRAVGAHHPQVVVGDCPALLIAGSLERLERAAVVAQRPLVISLDVGQDAEILLDPPPNGGIAPAELERLEVAGPRLVDGPALEGEPREHVERLAGEDLVADRTRDLEAALDQLLRRRALVAMVVYHGEAPERLRLGPVLPCGARELGRLPVGTDRVAYLAVALVPLGLLQ